MHPAFSGQLVDTHQGIASAGPSLHDGPWGSLTPVSHTLVEFPQLYCFWVGLCDQQCSAEVMSPFWDQVIKDYSFCLCHSWYPLFFFFYLFFYFLPLHYYIGFAIYQNESATGIHVFPILNPPPSSLPIPFLWVVLVHQPQASSIVHRIWTGNSFHTWYYTCFNAILPNHPTLSLSHWVQKTVLYISVSFALSYIRLLLPSF